MTLPTKDQIAEAVRMVNKAHASFGYRKPLRDAEVIVWATFFAIALSEPAKDCSR
jgi:hypothetical protein